MFEEDFDRCFICQRPCTGLYCSSECRLQDRGTTHLSPQPSKQNGLHLTATLPASLSPLIRPTYQVTPSPRMPAHLPADSSSSSSTTSSPLQSPRTNPSAADSPLKEAFHLPPPAYPPHQSLAFGSVPVKIPVLLPRPAPSTVIHGETPASHGTIYQTGASVDTLRFGRRPATTNSVTSPKALLPRCACGQPANHKGRRASQYLAEVDDGFSRLALGSSTLQDRTVSDPAVTTSSKAKGQRSTSTHAAPALRSMSINPTANDRTIADVMLGGLSLSRSRSDPSSPSNKSRAGFLPPPKAVSPLKPSQELPVDNDADPSVLVSPRRGRSRERQDHPTDDLAMAPTNRNHDSPHLFDRSRTRSREAGPSRSRHRRERSRERREAQAAPEIMPSWSRRVPEGGNSVAPMMRRVGSGGGQERGRADDREGRAQGLRRASNQLGQVFGVAAG
ncbi:hypothetical protein P7C73_g6562, partial [Tremellales sp. Uapishka_1]